MKEEAAAAAAKSLQSCPTLCNPRNGSPPGSPVPGILQARTLEWVAISFSNAGKWRVKVKSLNRVQLSESMDCSPPGSSVHRIFPGKSTGASWLNINNTKLWTNKKDMCQIYICFFKKWLDVMCHFTRQQIAQAWGKTWEIIIANWNRIFYTAPKTLILIISGSSWRK